MAFFSNNSLPGVIKLKGNQVVRRSPLRETKFGGANIGVFNGEKMIFALWNKKRRLSAP